jgi:hypothetical protein
MLRLTADTIRRDDLGPSFAPSDPTWAGAFARGAPARGPGATPPTTGASPGAVSATPADGDGPVLRNNSERQDAFHGSRCQRFQAIFVMQSLWGAKTSSRRQDVLVNDTAETIPTQNTSFTGCQHRCSRPPGLRCRERQRSMWPVPVVVIDEHLEAPLKMLIVQNAGFVHPSREPTCDCSR